MFKKEDPEKLSTELEGVRGAAMTLKIASLEPCHLALPFCRIADSHCQPRWSNVKLKRALSLRQLQTSPMVCSHEAVATRSAEEPNG